MSVKAYRIESKQIKGRVWTSAVQNPTFNYSHDDNIRLFLTSRALSEQLSDDGCGVFSIHVDSLKEAIKTAETLGLTEQVLENLKADLKYAEKKKTQRIDYECY